MTCKTFALCWLFLLATTLPYRVLPAHDGHEKGAHQHNDSDTAPATVGTGLILPSIEGPQPWSSKPALTDPNRFSIAIMTDRTGGHRPGIWMKAVERMNWLRPDFVVSVGDLIEGYTEDDREIESQWQEFLGFIDQLDMKFFFVAGNHDVTNPKLHRIWREKFGKEWYSFDYKGVHFVCLSSEDPTAHLGEQQLDWLEADLHSHRDARWTLLFLHKPLWAIGEREVAAGNADTTNWPRVAELLADRPHTVFAGHVHHYVQYERNGQQYYSLATTGGSSQLRGLDYGEFDHITWLTMEHDGPRVANLLLDGIQPAEVVTEDSINQFRDFLAKVRFQVEPIFISDHRLQQGEIRVTLRNDYDTPVIFAGTISGLPLVGLDMESEQIRLVVPPGETHRQVVPFSMKEPVDLSRFRLTELTAKISSVENDRLRAEWSVPVVIDHEYSIHASTPTVDGQLEDWEPVSTWWQTQSTPELVGAVAQWNGKQDASFAVSASYDAERLYAAIKVNDDHVMKGDQLHLSIDPRPLLSRVADPRLRSQSIDIIVDAPQSTELQACSIRAGRGQLRGLTAFGKQTSEGYQVELSVANNKLIREQGEAWPSIQLGVRQTDLDAQEDPAVEVLWRFSPDPASNRQHAHLLRK